MAEKLVCSACGTVDSDGERFSNGDCLCRECYNAVIDVFFEPKGRLDTTRAYTFMIPKRPMKKGK
ncbi:hypothetical protein [Oceanobacillus neutriphilus]|uniref:Inhibitor of sigma-G Gin protein n=1 Tax=Oceanobacillus neutriphilus TaxID=531815 RepID=A0ABQ2NTQ7_9BACI|nr:hypothetical protein [Oceanobacillus neutriphilus]GGP09835.1 hypothetical protein GCM10011346_15530 [Oceanobacillus neutriphilus]